MKKFFTLLVLAACCAAMTWGCSDDKYDDTEIRQEIENLKQEIASMKEQVNSLKTIIDALNENKFITNYTEAADGSCTITFNDGKTITLHNGKDGAAAPAIGIAQFEGIYYWTLGGDDQWLLDDNQNKIPVAGQNGKTPTINKDGYWEIDGETIKGEDGQPIKAVGKDGANGDKGEDGDSFFKSVVQDDENVTFTLTNGDQIVLPKAKEVNFVIERTSLTWSRRLPNSLSSNSNMKDVPERCAATSNRRPRRHSTSPVMTSASMSKPMPTMTMPMMSGQTVRCV